MIFIQNVPYTFIKALFSSITEYDLDSDKYPIYLVYPPTNIQISDFLVSDLNRLLLEILPIPTRPELMNQLNLLLQIDLNWGRLSILDLKRLVECVRRIK